MFLRSQETGSSRARPPLSSSRPPLDGPLPCLALLGLAVGLGVTPAVAGDDPFADEVISYDQGANPAEGYTDPTTALGAPERFTGEGVFPSVVSPFSPPFGLDEIVSIGAGGHLTLRFDIPVEDDDLNPFGIDLIVFGNAGFIDSNWPAGVVGGLFSDDRGLIEVSDDGITWYSVNEEADSLFPTCGYLDSGPYDDVPGVVETDFTAPVDPGLTIADFMGLGYAEVLALYDGSGGGTGIDIHQTGLIQISYVRITSPIEVGLSVEIDGMSDVTPLEPSADLDADGDVDSGDLAILLGEWGPCAGLGDACDADLNRDGAVDSTDLAALLGAWTG